ncbi:hypothetical protein B7494_g2603 [Chlorociboria aeruginascens]|nr:hypothetical protein B7494_g2603 [Chlorociboria aeruginascens]
MIPRNGVCLASKTATLQSSSAGRFFGIFYQWSKIGCATSLRYDAQHFHTELPRNSQSPSEELSATQIPDISAPVRSVMRNLPHTVVVLTTTYQYPRRQIKGQSKFIENDLWGITLSSFQMASLYPSPIITFNIMRPSHTLSALKNSGNFLIHILHATEKGAAIADHFTRPGPFQGMIFSGRSGEIGFGVSRKDLHMNGGEWQLSLPMLQSEAIAWVLRCEIIEKGVLEDEKKGMLSVGKHTMVFARVIEVIDPHQEHKMAVDKGIANKSNEEMGKEDKIEEVEVKKAVRERAREWPKRSILSYAFTKYRRIDMRQWIEIQKIETPAANRKAEKKKNKTSAVKDTNEDIASDGANSDEAGDAKRNPGAEASKAQK